MKLEEEFVGGTAQFAALLRKIADQLEADNLSVRGKKVTLPDIDMEHKISHKNDLGANRFTITIEWLDG
ncbi:amphi-Trp domain-containing protein [Paenibacillus radicis (ex Xue et al. 2023)]|uniref:Amphi-Trp domain-containing protein n=1 Tax=Paenibacillus radicis (ex Xue et al. 2023) TaxID=2972489 RepID=A0ABT1YRB4_9BACL|nr:amphi-Trp domain-containing protein [Paenibacillus radicis (ex Xue et al. 2023)]MCR8635725.1 amphi-Trp domain-containing protein [Paenibacillus radicis (ex Xue et al. 2023)]